MAADCFADSFDSELCTAIWVGTGDERVCSHPVMRMCRSLLGWQQGKQCTKCVHTELIDAAMEYQILADYLECRACHM